MYRYDNGKWSFLKNVKKRNVITTTDKNVQAGKTYQYRVLAYRVMKGKNIYSSKSKARKITLKTATVKGDYQYGSVYGPYLDAQHLAQVRSVVQSFKINYIRKGMSDYDRVLTAYNYLRSNCSYAYKGWQYNYANTAWGALVLDQPTRENLAAVNLPTFPCRMFRISGILFWWDLLKMRMRHRDAG